MRPSNKIETNKREIRVSVALLNPKTNSAGVNTNSMISKSKIKNTRVSKKYRIDNGIRLLECCSNPHS